MTGRFFYHAFWNFYDYLGSLTLIGLAFSFAVFGSSFGVILAASVLPAAVTWLLIVIISTFVLALALSGTLAFCGKAANIEPARWPDFKAGIRQSYRAVLFSIFLWIAAALLLSGNCVFYLGMITRAGATFPMRLAWAAALGLVGWIALTWGILLPPLLAATSDGNCPTLRSRFRQAAASLVLAPGIWLTVFSGMIIYGSLCWAFPYLLIFAVPLLASVSQTAWFLTRQYMNFISEVSNRQNPGNIRSIKREARALGYSWEASQPKRTLKELFKPWQM